MRFVPKPLVDSADASAGREQLQSSLRFALLVIAVLLGSWLALGWLADAMAQRLPDAWERKLAFSPAGSNLDDPRASEIGSIAAFLQIDEPLRALDYRIAVLDLPEANAFAFPGGGMAVTRGLLDLQLSEKAMAFVLAHELGHHQLRHTLRSLGRALLLRVALSLVGFHDGGAGLQASFQAAERSFSRSQELAADRFALELVIRRYGDADGALAFFESQAEAPSTSAWLDWLGTHPAAKERIAALRRAEAEILEQRFPAP
jgi:beta-barrel assembly-enhancing protease